MATAKKNKMLSNYQFKDPNGEVISTQYSIAESDVKKIEQLFKQVQKANLSSYHLGILVRLIDSVQWRKQVQEAKSSE